MSSHSIAHFSAGRVILLTIAGTILLGTFLLAMPISRLQEIPIIDLFFTATSATCVTGLFTVPLDQFSQFGQCIILLLIQVGGLGMITLSMFLFSLLFDLGFKGQLITERLLELEYHRNIKHLLLFIVSITILIESIGFMLFFLIFSKQYSFGHAFFLSLFHAISFFCNAGITLFNNSLAPYSHNSAILLISASLMLLGGIGFLTIYETLQFFGIVGEEKRSFSLQSKIIIYGTLSAIALTTIIILILEHNHAFASFSPFLKIVNAFFHAISFRSTGLLSVSIASFQFATIFIIMVISFIGSSPGSTGSGIRITTLAIYWAVVKAAVTAHVHVNIRGRRIAKDQINKAIAIVSLSIVWIVITTFFLLITEKNWDFLDVLFESVCAFTNLGLTTGITLALTFIGKIFIMLSMIVGRIGSLTLVVGLRKLAWRKSGETAEPVYPEERIMLS